MSRTIPGEVAFSYPIETEPGLARCLWEHKDGNWSIVTFRPKVVEAAKTKPLDPECTFDMEELIRTATMAFTGSPSIRDDKNAGKKLAAGVLMFAAALGILDMNEFAG